MEKSNPLSTRLPIVGVMGSGKEPHLTCSSQIGKWLAESGVHLLTGGGGGVMEAVSRAFFQTANRAGKVVGVLPGTVSEKGYQSASGYPNPWVEIPIYTHLPYSGLSGQEVLSRNHINILSSDVVIILPGGAGTASEARLALFYNRPAVAYLAGREDIRDLPAEIPVENSFGNVKQFVLSNLSGYLRR